MTLAELLRQITPTHEVDVTQWVYGNDASYVYKVAHNIGISVSTRLTSTRRWIASHRITPDERDTASPVPPVRKARRRIKQGVSVG